MSRKRRSTFALSSSCGGPAEDAHGLGLWLKSPRWRLWPCGQVTPLCRLQLLNLHSLPDQFHFLLHYFLFTAVYISTFISFILRCIFFFFFTFFYTNDLLHSFDESILEEQFSSLISILHAQPDVRHSCLLECLHFIRELFLRAAPPCPLCPRGPDVDSISAFIIFFLSNLGTHVSMAMQILRDLTAVNILRFTEEGQRMWKGERNPAESRLRSLLMNEL